MADGIDLSKITHTERENHYAIAALISWHDTIQEVLSANSEELKSGSHTPLGALECLSEKLLTIGDAMREHAATALLLAGERRASVNRDKDRVFEHLSKMLGVDL